MSTRHAEIVRDFGDGAYRFRLALGQLRELEEKRNAPATVIFARISTGSFWIDDLRETMRLALIGGGDVTPVQALKLIERYVDERPAYEWMKIATDVLAAALVAPLNDQPKKKEGSEAVQTSGSTSVESTATVQ